MVPSLNAAGGTLLRNFMAIPFTQLCSCLSEETLKVVGPFYLVSNTVTLTVLGEVKVPRKTAFCLWAIPQKMLPQGEKKKLTYKVCFRLKINEKGLHLDDEVKKVGNNMTSIYFAAIKRDHILQEL